MADPSVGREAEEKKRVVCLIAVSLRERERDGQRKERQRGQSEGKKFIVTDGATEHVIRYKIYQA